jgi:hypothetical protein
VLCAVCYAVQADQLRKISEMHEEMIANTQIKQVRGGAFRTALFADALTHSLTHKLTPALSQSILVPDACTAMVHELPCLPACPPGAAPQISAPLTHCRAAPRNYPCVMGCLSASLPACLPCCPTAVLTACPHTDRPRQVLPTSYSTSSHAAVAAPPAPHPPPVLNLKPNPHTP